MAVSIFIFIFVYLTAISIWRSIHFTRGAPHVFRTSPLFIAHGLMWADNLGSLRFWGRLLSVGSVVRDVSLHVTAPLDCGRVRCGAPGIWLMILSSVCMPHSFVPGCRLAVPCATLQWPCRWRVSHVFKAAVHDCWPCFPK